MNTKPKSHPVFQHPVLEFLSRSSIWIILALDSFIIFLILYSGLRNHPGLANKWYWFLLGLFSWTLLEYVLHRYAFHFEPKSPKLQKIIYPLHAFHHDYPFDKQHLFMPPMVNAILAALFFLIAKLLLGTLAYLFTPGLILGYLLYSSMHYAMHTIKPPFPFLKTLWRNHQLHHHRFPERGYGVSSPVWDYVFGTVPPKSVAEKISGPRKNTKH